MDRNKLIDLYNKFCANLGINSLYPITFMLLLISMVLLKDLKKWESISSQRKRYDIMGWILTALLLIYSLSIMTYNILNK